MNYTRYFLITFMSLLFASAANETLIKISTEDAPKTRGPYSQAIRVGDLLFISGQLGIDPKTETLADNTISGQTKQALNNIEAILYAAGATFEHVVKMEIYLKNLNILKRVDKVYAEYFHHDIKPCRQIIQVVKLPLNARIEIACIAYIPEK